MRIALDAKMRTRDGDDAGTVRRVIVDPRTNEVTDLVVRTGGLLGRYVLVPFQEVESAPDDGGALRLRLGPRDLERLPAYQHAYYGTPPAGFAAPTAFGLPFSGYARPLWGTAGQPAPSVQSPPNDSTPERGLATTQAERSSTLIQDLALPAVTTVAKGAIVLGSDGKEIGVVDDVDVDPETGRITGITLRAGGLLRTLFGGGERIHVSGAGIAEVGEESVRVNSSKEAFERLSD